MSKIESKGRTAFLLTFNKLDQKIAVTNDFVAYAIDWEMEWQELTMSHIAQSTNL